MARRTTVARTTSRGRTLDEAGPDAERVPRPLGRRADARRDAGEHRARRRLGAPPPRPRRPDLHRPARPLGHRPARLPPGTAGEAFALAEALRPEHVRHRAAARSSRRERGQRQPEPRRPARSRSRSRRGRRLAEAETPPFPLDEDVEVDELLRLRHRYLDLRREPMQRHAAAAPHGRARDAPRARRARLPRHRDADPHASRRPRARATSSSRTGASRARGTRCRSRRSSSSSC